MMSELSGGHRGARIPSAFARSSSCTTSRCIRAGHGGQRVCHADASNGAHGHPATGSRVAFHSEARALLVARERVFDLIAACLQRLVDRHGVRPRDSEDILDAGGDEEISVLTSTSAPVSCGTGSGALRLLALRRTVATATGVVALRHLRDATAPPRWRRRSIAVTPRFFAKATYRPYLLRRIIIFSLTQDAHRRCPREPVTRACRQSDRKLHDASAISSVRPRVISADKKDLKLAPWGRRRGAPAGGGPGATLAGALRPRRARDVGGWPGSQPRCAGRKGSARRHRAAPPPLQTTDN
jgi:hypothetical protein